MFNTAAVILFVQRSVLLNYCSAAGIVIEVVVVKWQFVVQNSSIIGWNVAVAKQE